MSRALRNSHQISDAQKEAVHAAARKLDYRAHLKRPTPSFLTISVYSEDVDLAANGSVYRGIYDGLKDEASQHNCRIVQISLRALQRQLAAGTPKFESLVLLGCDREELFGPLAQTQLPIVLVNAQDALNRLDSVLPDSFGCGVLIADHLRQQGCRSTLHIVHQKRVTHLRRLEGYFGWRKQAPDAPADLQDAIVDPGSFEEIDLPATRANLKTQPDALDLSQFDSVICWGAQMQLAFGAVAPPALSDLVVVSVDHVTGLDHQPPNSVTVLQQADAMGRQAVQQLVTRQVYPTAPRVRTLLSVEIDGTQILR